ncbi:MAG: transposase [PVC group bacterium]
MNVKFSHGISHNRRSIRLRGYDYSRKGAYYVTTCVKNGAHLFGKIIDGRMVLNDAGGMIRTVWDELPIFYLGIGIDVFQIMPDHVHGIVIVGATPRGCPPGRPPVGAPPCGCPFPGQAEGPGEQAREPAPTDHPGLSLPDIVHRFKTMTTKRYIDGVKQHNWPPFSGKLWQRNYYEHIIRDEHELNEIREYIAGNPARWHMKREKRQKSHRLNSYISGKMPEATI